MILKLPGKSPCTEKKKKVNYFPELDQGSETFKRASEVHALGSELEFAGIASAKMKLEVRKL